MYVLRRDPVSGVNGVTAVDIDRRTLYRTGHYRTSIAFARLRMLVNQRHPDYRIEMTGRVELP